MYCLIKKQKQKKYHFFSWGCTEPSGPSFESNETAKVANKVMHIFEFAYNNGVVLVSISINYLTREQDSLSRGIESLVVVCIQT
jgi:hypothetical protein